jgi:hypothetical protein
MLYVIVQQSVRIPQSLVHRLLIASVIPVVGLFIGSRCVMVRMPRQAHVQGGELREHVIDEYRRTKGSIVEHIVNG